MAVNIGPKIGLEGEAEYRKSLQNIIQQQKTLNSELGKTTSAFNKDTTAAKKVQTQREALTKQIKLQEERVAELTEGLNKCAEAEGESSTKTLKWQQVVNEATTELNKMKSELEGLPNQVQLLGDSMKEAGDKMKNIGDSISSVGKKLSVVSTAVIGVGTVAVKSAAEFDQSMSSVEAVSGATAEELEQLREKAKELGSTTNYSAKEVADAMTDMAKAGWSAQDIMNGMNGVLEATTASGEDLANVSEIVADAITTFGLSASDSSRVADVLTYAANAGTLSIADLGESFKNVGPIAKTMGISVEDVSTALEIMSQSGIKGSEAGTALKNVLTNLNGTSSTVKGALDELGISISNDDGTFKSFTEIVDLLRDSFSGLTDEQKTSYAYTIAGKTGMNGLLTILNATEEEYNAISTAMNNCNGTASDTATIMQDNLASQTEILKNKLQVLGIELVENLMPALTNLVNKASEVVTWFSNLDEGTQNTILKVAGLVAVAGPLLVIGGKVISGIGTIVSAGGSLLSWAGSLGQKAGQVASSAGSAASGLTNLGSSAAGSVSGVSGAATSFGQLAGQALSLVALGAGIALAAVGIKQLAEAAVLLSSNGVGAVGTMVLMVGAVAGLAAGAAVLGPALTAGAVGFIAFGAAMVGIGAGIWLICEGVVALSPELKNISDYGGSAALALGELALSSAGLGASLVVLAAGAGTSAISIGAMDLAMAGLVLTLAGVNLAFGDLPKTMSKLATNSTTASTNLSSLNTNLGSYKTKSKDAKTNSDNLNTSIGNLDTKFKGLKTTLSNMSTTFTSINTSFSTMLNNLNNSATIQLNKLKSLFSNTKLSLNQNIALPHFSMSGSFNARTKSVPSVNVSWYKKAYENGVMFNSPTVLATANGLKGFGDGVGSEIVIGENKLLSTIQTAVNRGNGGMVVNMTINASEGMDVNELASKVEDRLNRALQRKKGAFAV